MKDKFSLSIRWYEYIPTLQLRHIEIRHRLIIAFILLSLLPLLISGYIAYVDSDNAIEDKTRIFSTEVVKQVSKNIKLRMEQIDNESASLVFSNKVQHALTAFADNNETESSTARRDLTQILLDQYGATSYINQKYFLDKQHRVVDMQVFAQLTSGVARFVNKAKFSSGQPQWGSYDNGVGQQNIGMVRTVVSKNNNEVIGAIFLAINPAHFSAIFDNVDPGSGSAIYVLDSITGQVVVWPPENQPLGSVNMGNASSMLGEMAGDLKRGVQNGFITFKDSNREQFVAAYAAIPDTSWLVINAIPKSRLIAEIQSVRNKMAIIGVLCFLFAIVLGTIIANSISRPLKDLMKRIDATGNLVDPAAHSTNYISLEKTEGNDELSRLTLSFAAMNDIVNQKIAHINEINATLEQKIIERTAALAAREQESRTLIENSPDSIVRFDLECRRTFVNPTFEALSSNSAQSLLGKKPTELPGGLNGKIYEAKIKEVITTGKKGLFEMRWTRDDGKEMCSHIRMTPEFNSNGNIISVMSVGRDITELNLSRSELNLANVQLAEMNTMLESLATLDPLTQLPNRRLLLDRLHRALPASERNGRYGAIMFIDLDHFKTLNDTLGHDVGDALLRQVAQRLQLCVRDADTVARIGGDEFIVMLENLSEAAFEAASQTEVIGNKILEALSQAFQLASSQYQISASVGATLFNGTQQSAEDVLRQGDIAMYQVKKSGRNALRFFDPRMHEAVHARAQLEAELRKAIADEQFELYYQIQVSNQPDDGSLMASGAEALIRWVHPSRGLIEPNTFISLSEETGLILQIGEWVLDRACAQLHAWQNDPLTRNLTLAVNVSSRQFVQTDFVAYVMSVINRHGINPKLLKLELTEGLLLDNIDETIIKMNQLNEIGVQFSLDDFGTGYSSLQYLKRLPLNQLKIDQSFVQDIVVSCNDMAIVTTVIAMAKSLHLNVIAEGVETEAQFKLLVENGCHHFQGYWFGKPVQINDFKKNLTQI